MADVESKKYRPKATALTVARNVARLRARLNLNIPELGRRLESVGHPMTATSLTRLEGGLRRVDADDLMALAVVFGVSPLTLLLPPDGSREETSPMTGVPDREVSHNTQWLWALGKEPLELPGTGISAKDKREIVLFQMRALPDVEARNAAVAGFRTEDSEEDDDQKLLDQVSGLAKAQGLFISNGDD